MSGTISNLEIFATGTHRAQTGTITVTDDDLQKIIEAFNALHGSNIVKPHLKLGHTDAQKWFGQKDGIPTLGWITKVWRQGRKLLANVTDVPDELIKLLKKNRFHNVSAEIFWDANIEHEGRKFPRVLSAVSLLGVEMPAVKDLAGIASALFKAEPIHQFSDAIPVSLFIEKGDVTMPDDPKNTDVKLLYSQEQHDNLVKAAVKSALDEQKAKFDADLKSKNEELGVMTKRAEGAEKELANVKASAAQKEAESLVDKAIEDGKLLPKQKDFALAFLQDDSKVKFGEKGEEKTRAELFQDFINSQGKQIDLGESGSGDNKQHSYATAAEEIDQKAKQLLSSAPDKYKDYSAAFNAVKTKEPELAKKYAEEAIN